MSHPYDNRGYSRGYHRDYCDNRSYPLDNPQQSLFPAYGRQHPPQSYDQPHNSTSRALFSAYPQRVSPQSYDGSHNSAFRSSGFETSAEVLQRSVIARREWEKAERLKKIEKEKRENFELTIPQGQIKVSLNDDDESVEEEEEENWKKSRKRPKEVPVDPKSTKESSKKKSSKKNKSKKNKNKKKKDKSKKKKDKKKGKRKGRKRSYSSSSSSSTSSSSSDSSSSEDEKRKQKKNRKRRRHRSTSTSSYESESPRPKKVLRKMRQEENIYNEPYKPSHIVVDDRSDPKYIDNESKRLVPKYRTVSYGLDGAMKPLVLNTPPDPHVDRYFCDEVKAFFEKAQASERRFRTRQLEHYFVPLSSSPFDPETEEEVKEEFHPQELNSMTADDYEARVEAKHLSYETATIPEKAKIMRARCSMNKRDVKAWLAFIGFQKQLFAFEESQDYDAPIRNTKAYFERQNEIFRKAMAENPNNVELALGRVKLLFDQDANDEWRRLKNKYVNQPRMWDALLKENQNQRSSFTYPDMINLIDECIENLVDVKDRVKVSHPPLDNTEEFLVEKIIHRLKLMLECGFMDGAVFLFQALSEFHLFPSKPMPNAHRRFSESRILLSSFDSFYQHGLPRIGDKNARGWCNSVVTPPNYIKEELEDIAKETQQIEKLEGELMSKLKAGCRPSDIETWRQIEILRAEHYWRPVRIMNQTDTILDTVGFVSRMLSLDDFTKVFFTFRDKSLATELILRCAQMLGATIPGITDYSQESILRAFAGNKEMFPRLRLNYRDLDLFFERYFSLLIDSRNTNVDRSQIYCARLETRLDMLLKSKPRKNTAKRKILQWSQEIYALDEDIVTKVFCFLTIAKCYEKFGMTKQALRTASMILGQCGNIWEMEESKAAAYFEVARWLCRRLPFGDPVDVKVDSEESKPCVVDNVLVPLTKYQLLFALGVNGSLITIPASNDANRKIAYEKWKSQLYRKTFHPKTLFTFENEAIAELGITFFYECAHHIGTFNKCFDKSMKTLGALTPALYHLKLDVFENNMKTFTLISPINRDKLLQEAVQACPTDVSLLKRYVDTCRRNDVCRFLLLNQGEGIVRRVRSCALVYAEWLYYLNNMELAIAHQQGHVFSILRYALETAAQTLTNESSIPDGYLWSILMFLEQERNSPLRRIDELLVLAQQQCPWSKQLLLEAAKKRPNSGNFKTELEGILNSTGIQKYTGFEEISTLYLDDIHEDEEYEEVEAETYVDVK